ncbi:uncharacterized protein LOC110725397 [Chenopodium quinoa]|uniref:uncharacterized protein LOC110725397 n=1 Tax=Chenopodium quinoa TaxID=63459 RepID=UPI000B76DF29|nr:uncharacterized protein LOC110725397 [Chenopodium quinoa]
MRLQKFETFGILCKHMFRIFDQNLVFDIPEKYILTRWRKDVNRRHTRVKVPYHDPSHSAQVKRSYKMLTTFEPISDIAACIDDEAVHHVLTSLKKLQGEVAALKQKKDLLNKAEEVTHFPADGSQVEQQSCCVGSTVASVQKQDNNPPYSNDTPAAGQEHVTNLSVDADNIHWSQQHAPPPIAPKKSIILDPVVQIKRRGRPKGSRNKTLAEMGYKKAQPKEKQPDHSAQFILQTYYPSSFNGNIMEKKETLAGRTWCGREHGAES